MRAVLLVAVLVALTRPALALVAHRMRYSDHGSAWWAMVLAATAKTRRVSTGRPRARAAHEGHPRQLE